MRTFGATVTATSLAIATIVTWASMFQVAGADLGVVVLGLWAAAPYAVFFALFRSQQKFGRSHHLASLVTAVLMLIFACAFYIYVGWGTELRSTTPIAYVVGPVYAFVGGAIVWASTWVMAGGLRKSK